MNWLQIVAALVQLAPSIIQLVLQIEAAIGPGNGNIKKSMVMAALAPAPPEVLSHAGSMIDSLVTGLNSAGTFKKAA